MDGSNNQLYQLLSVVLPVIVPVVVSYVTWLMSKNQDVFNLRKIQKYNSLDYQDAVFSYQTFFSIINPVIFLEEFIIALNVAANIDSNYYVQLLWLIMLYGSLLMVLLVVEFVILSEKKEKLKTITASISEEFSKMMLTVDNKKSLIYKANMFFFSSIWLIFIYPPNIKVTNVVILFWTIYYIISIFYMICRLSKYKTRGRIKSKTIIRMDYRKDYGCYFNIILKKNFSFKFQEDKIVIYYPGDISSYTIKQDNLINITVGYRAEYTDTFANKK